jgi:D-serine ammonia-lyase
MLAVDWRADTDPKKKNQKIKKYTRRAGVPIASFSFQNLLTTVLNSPVVSLFGFYCHHGRSYASTSQEEASSFLSQELEDVNAAAGLALDILDGFPNSSRHSIPFTLSIGSTPTMHAASDATRFKLKHQLNGLLELHAGNYPLLDLQQLSTSLIEPQQISQRVLATVVSYYPGRGENGEDEAMCDAGAIAMSKDRGPIGRFGEVVGKRWRLSRISQEHGILTRTARTLVGNDTEQGGLLEIGEQISIVGQHACLIAAAYPWIYVCDSDAGKTDTVVDVWVPWKGW